MNNSSNQTRSYNRSKSAEEAKSLPEHLISRRSSYYQLDINYNPHTEHLKLKLLPVELKENRQPKNVKFQETKEGTGEGAKKHKHGVAAVNNICNEILRRTRKFSLETKVKKELFLHKDAEKSIVKSFLGGKNVEDLVQGQTGSREKSKVKVRGAFTATKSMSHESDKTSSEFKCSMEGQGSLDDDENNEGVAAEASGKKRAKRKKEKSAQTPSNPEGDAKILARLIKGVDVKRDPIDCAIGSKQLLAKVINEQSEVYVILFSKNKGPEMREVLCAEELVEQPDRLEDDGRETRRRMKEKRYSRHDSLMKLEPTANAPGPSKLKTLDKADKDVESSGKPEKLKITAEDTNDGSGRNKKKKKKEGIKQRSSSLQGNKQSKISTDDVGEAGQKRPSNASPGSSKSPSFQEKPLAVASSLEAAIKSRSGKQEGDAVGEEKVRVKRRSGGQSKSAADMKDEGRSKTARKHYPSPASVQSLAKNNTKNDEAAKREVGELKKIKNSGLKLRAEKPEVAVAEKPEEIPSPSESRSKSKKEKAASKIKEEVLPDKNGEILPDRNKSGSKEASQSKKGEWLNPFLTESNESLGQAEKRPEEKETEPRPVKKRGKNGSREGSPKKLAGDGKMASSTKSSPVGDRSPNQAGSAKSDSPDKQRNDEEKKPRKKARKAKEQEASRDKGSVPESAQKQTQRGTSESLETAKPKTKRKSSPSSRKELSGETLDGRAFEESIAEKKASKAGGMQNADSRSVPEKLEKVESALPKRRSPGQVAAKDPGSNAKVAIGEENTTVKVKNKHQARHKPQDLETRAVRTKLNEQTQTEDVEMEPVKSQRAVEEPGEKYKVELMGERLRAERCKVLRMRHSKKYSTSDTEPPDAKKQPKKARKANRSVENASAWKHLRKEVSFSQLRLQPVVANYASPSRMLDLEQEQEHGNRACCADGLKKKRSVLRSIERKTVLSEVITRRERDECSDQSAELVNLFAKAKKNGSESNHFTRKLICTENVIETSVKASDEYDSSSNNNYRLVVEGIEPPKRLGFTSGEKKKGMAADGERKAKNLHKTVFSVMEIESAYPSPLPTTAGTNTLLKVSSGTLKKPPGAKVMEEIYESKCWKQDDFSESDDDFLDQEAEEAEEAMKQASYKQTSGYDLIKDLDMIIEDIANSISSNPRIPENCAFDSQPQYSSEGDVTSATHHAADVFEPQQSSCHNLLRISIKEVSEPSVSATNRRTFLQDALERLPARRKSSSKHLLINNKPPTLLVAKKSTKLTSFSKIPRHRRWYSAEGCIFNLSSASPKHLGKRTKSNNSYMIDHFLVQRNKKSEVKVNRRASFCSLHVGAPECSSSSAVKKQIDTFFMAKPATSDDREPSIGLPGLLTSDYGGPLLEPQELLSGSDPGPFFELAQLVSRCNQGSIMGLPILMTCDDNGPFVELPLLYNGSPCVMSNAAVFLGRNNGVGVADIMNENLEGSERSFKRKHRTKPNKNRKMSENETSSPDSQSGNSAKTNNSALNKSTLLFTKDYKENSRISAYHKRKIYGELLRRYTKSSITSPNRSNRRKFNQSEIQITDRQDEEQSGHQAAFEPLISGSTTLLINEMDFRAKKVSSLVASESTADDILRTGGKTESAAPSTKTDEPLSFFNSLQAMKRVLSEHKRFAKRLRTCGNAATSCYGNQLRHATSLSLTSCLLLHRTSSEVEAMERKLTRIRSDRKGRCQVKNVDSPRAVKANSNKEFVKNCDEPAHGSLSTDSLEDPNRTPSALKKENPPPFKDGTNSKDKLNTLKCHVEKFVPNNNKVKYLVYSSLVNFDNYEENVKTPQPGFSGAFSREKDERKKRPCGTPISDESGYESCRDRKAAAAPHFVKNFVNRSTSLFGMGKKKASKKEVEVACGYPIEEVVAIEADISRSQSTLGFSRIPSEGTRSPEASTSGLMGYLKKKTSLVGFAEVKRKVSVLFKRSKSFEEKDDGESTLAIAPPVSLHELIPSLLGISKSKSKTSDVSRNLDDAYHNMRFTRQKRLKECEEVCKSQAEKPKCGWFSRTKKVCLNPRRSAPDTRPKSNSTVGFKMEPKEEFKFEPDKWPKSKEDYWPKSTPEEQLKVKPTASVQTKTNKETSAQTTNTENITCTCVATECPVADKIEPGTSKPHYCPCPDLFANPPETSNVDDYKAHADSLRMKAKRRRIDQFRQLAEFEKTMKAAKKAKRSPDPPPKAPSKVDLRGCPSEVLKHIEFYQHQMKECKQYAQKVRIRTELLREGHVDSESFKEIPLNVMLGKQIVPFTKPKSAPPVVKDAKTTTDAKDEPQKKVDSMTEIYLKDVQDGDGLVVTKSKLNPLFDKNKQQEAEDVGNKSEEDVWEKDYSDERKRSIGFIETSSGEINDFANEISDASLARGFDSSETAGTIESKATSETDHPVEDDDSVPAIETISENKEAEEKPTLEEQEPEPHKPSEYDQSKEDVSKASPRKYSKEEEDEVRNSLTDQELFEKVLNKFEQEEQIAKRLSLDDEFFTAQLSSVKNTDSVKKFMEEETERRKSMERDPSWAERTHRTEKRYSSEDQSAEAEESQKRVEMKAEMEIEEFVREAREQSEMEHLKVTFSKDSDIFKEEKELLGQQPAAPKKILREKVTKDEHNQGVADSGKVLPSEIGKCFRRGFRPDNATLSGEACFTAEQNDQLNMDADEEEYMVFSEKETPLEYLLALGFSVDEASNAIKDEDVKNRLFAAITEARVWINQITTSQGTLLYLLSYKAKPKIMRYFLQLVEAIINKRINNAVKLDGFLRLLEKIEDNEISMVAVLGMNQFEDEENEEKMVKKQLKKIFIDVYKVADDEATKKGKSLPKSSVLLLRILAAKYRAGLIPHLELIARYIGQGLLVNEVQLEAAMIYLSRLATANVNIKEFEEYCAIECEKSKHDD